MSERPGTATEDDDAGDHRDEGDAGAETSRLSAAEIFDRVTAGAREELVRPAHNLVFSAIAAGLTMGLSAIGVALLDHELGPGHDAVAALGYPAGFLVVILGRHQLFTENTLFPVALVLQERRRLASTARLWGIVLVGNVVGAFAFALLAVRTPAFDTAHRDAIASLGSRALEPGAARVFWSAVIAGWMIALVAWLVTASTDTAAQVLVIVFLTYLVGLGHLAHSVAGTTEVLSALVRGDADVGDGLRWFALAVAGNATGGVVMVALLDYGQVHNAAAHGS